MLQGWNEKRRKQETRDIRGKRRGREAEGGIEEGKHEVLGGKNRKQGTCIELGGDF